LWQRRWLKWKLRNLLEIVVLWYCYVQAPHVWSMREWTQQELNNRLIASKLRKNRFKWEAFRFIVRFSKSWGSKGARSGSISRGRRFTDPESSVFVKVRIWVSMPWGALLRKYASALMCPSFWSWKWIQVTGEKSKCNRELTSMNARRSWQN